MCGIVGYTGPQPAVPLLLEGLRHLEYRGYDSAGLAVVSANGHLEIRKAAGRLDRLTESLKVAPIHGRVGVGHTRWATHGRPSDENAHPHTDCTGRVCVVHNGVVENYRELRDQLLAQGHHFTSETDTEVLAHLIEVELTELPEASDGEGPRLLTACRKALDRVEGLYAIAAVSLDDPDLIVGARSRAPLIVGLSAEGNFLASDVPAVLGETRRVVRLKEQDLVALRPDSVLIVDRYGRQRERAVDVVTWDRTAAEKAGYPHFFLKEVYEQPEALERTCAGRLVDDHVVLPELSGLDVESIRRVVLTGCGSAYHACLMARYAFEAWLRLPVDVDMGSELRYRDVALDPSVLCIAVSQSGETADTLAAFELARAHGAQCVALTNSVGSAITSLADHVVYQHSGPEVAVVSSKTFTGQLTTLLLIGLALAERVGRATPVSLQKVVGALTDLPRSVQEALATAQDSSRIAERHAHVNRLLFLGRGVGYPTALEGALKLKEISYIHAEGYPAGELKHGPLALVEPGSLVVVLATRSATLGKLISNIEEVRARGGSIIAITSRGDDLIAPHADEIIRVPETVELVSPVVNVVPMQLLAYYAAVARGCDPDKPRNLAKSVTVE
ncbi:MAG: glutamine--fructose-6-phosphate transaminase (isomerizing) [Chloroflexi bacterium]|nr:glutamine--fructose-6-phosphate transaminase (isomerizing) [Chloroflexota bacterium]